MGKPRPRCLSSARSVLSDWDQQTLREQSNKTAASANGFAIPTCSKEEHAHATNCREYASNPLLARPKPRSGVARGWPSEGDACEHKVHAMPIAAGSLRAFPAKGMPPQEACRTEAEARLGWAAKRSVPPSRLRAAIIVPFRSIIGVVTVPFLHRHSFSFFAVDVVRKHACQQRAETSAVRTMAEKFAWI